MLGGIGEALRPETTMRSDWANGSDGAFRPVSRLVVLAQARTFPVWRRGSNLSLEVNPRLRGGDDLNLLPFAVDG